MKPAFLLLIPAMLVGQRAAAQEFRFGAKVGVNYSNAHHPDLTNSGTSPIYSYLLGATGRYSFAPTGFWNMQADLLYSRKGYLLDDFRNSQSQLQLNYVDLPVLAKINAHGLTFEAGPQLGYLVSTAYDTYFGTSHDRSPLRKFQLGYCVGVGYELQSGYSLTVRYNGDLLPVSKSSNGYLLRVFQAQVGYLLPSKRPQ